MDKPIGGFYVHRNTLVSADNQNIKKLTRGLCSQTISSTHRGDITCLDVANHKIATGSVVRLENLVIFGKTITNNFFNRIKRLTFGI